ERQEAAVLLAVVGDRARDFSLVERVATALPQHAKRSREVPLDEDRPRLRGLAPEEVRLGGGLRLLELLDLRRPVLGHLVGDREAVPGERDRRLEQLGKLS